MPGLTPCIVLGSTYLSDQVTHCLSLNPYKIDTRPIQLPFSDPTPPQTIYRSVLDDVYEYPVLEKELKEFQKILGMHRRQ